MTAESTIPPTLDSPSTLIAPTATPPNAARASGRKTKRPTAFDEMTGAAPEQPGVEPCPACKPDFGSSGKRKKSVWVGCDQCQDWYHWYCVAPSKLDSPDLIDKWFCARCVQASLNSPAPLRTVFKPPPRKSQRSTLTKLDYANLEANLPADPNRWLRVIETREVIEDAFQSIAVDDITDEWLWSEKSFIEPFLIERPEGLGMKMPDPEISIHQIAQEVGPLTPIEVIDVASQSSLSHWTLQQWADYYMDPRRDKVRNVISLEISESPFGQQVVAPEFVRKLDWVDTIWPSTLKGKDEYPRVQKYCLMSVEKCWTDWHVDFAGSSVYYHVLRGGKVFFFIRPTAANLAAYEKWSGSAELQESTWLGDMVDCVYKVTLNPGNTMIIPTGWPHAVFTPSDSLVIGGNFLHSLNIGTQLRVYAIELATKVPRKFRFPHFVRLLWFVADHYVTRLCTALSLGALPVDLNARVLDGLKQLSTFLVEQTSRFAKSPLISTERRRIAREHVPWQYIKNPVALARNLRMVVMRARGEELDSACFPPQEPLESTVKPELEAEVEGGSTAVSTPTTGRKRALDSADVHDSAPKAKRAPTTTTTHGPAVNGRSQPPFGSPLPRDAGEIILRETPPVSTHDARQDRLDPGRPDAPARPADVKTSQSSNRVVRRYVEPDTGAVIVETRSVVTQAERVRFVPSVSVSASAPVASAAQAPSVIANGAGAGKPRAVKPKTPSAKSSPAPSPRSGKPAAGSTTPLRDVVDVAL